MAKYEAAVFEGVESLTWRTGRTWVMRAPRREKEAITFLVSTQLVLFRGTVAYLSHWLELAPQVTWVPHELLLTTPAAPKLPKASLLRGAKSSLPPFLAPRGHGAITIQDVEGYMRKHLPWMADAPLMFALEPDFTCIVSRGHAELLGYDDDAIVGVCSKRWPSKIRCEWP